MSPWAIGNKPRDFILAHLHVFMTSDGPMSPPSLSSRATQGLGVFPNRIATDKTVEDSRALPPGTGC